MNKKFEEFYDTSVDNEDSKSDTTIALIIVIVAVVTALFWVSSQ